MVELRLNLRFIDGPQYHGDKPLGGVVKEKKGFGKYIIPYVLN